MEKVEYHTLERWGWICPDCGEWNEEEDDPGYQDTLICQNAECRHQFTPINGD